MAKKLTLIASAAILALIVAGSAYVYGVNLQAAVGDSGFKSVEVGVAELSPNGESGGYAVPASGDSYACSLTLTPSSMTTGSGDVRLTWSPNITLGVFRNGSYFGQQNSGWVDGSSSGLAPGTYTYSLYKYNTLSTCAYWEQEQECHEKRGCRFVNVCRHNRTEEYSCQRNLTVTSPAPPQCNDGVDNSDPEDTLADYPNDPGCGSASDTSESNPPQCSDGGDNDGDGAADYPADPGCSGAADNNEANQCSDSADNDTDGVSDTNDPGCHTDGNPSNPGSFDPNDNDETDPAPTFQCSDSADNDTDGVSDTNDPGCHTDGNPSNPGSFDPNDNDETDPASPSVTDFRVCNLGGSSCTTSGTKDINEGTEIEVTWNSSDATSCSVVQGSGAGFGTGGNTSGTDNTINEPSAGNSATFQIECTNGNAADDVTSNAITVNVNYTPPTINFKVCDVGTTDINDPSCAATKSVPTGTDVNLVWESNGDGCEEVQGPGFDTGSGEPANGSDTATPTGSADQYTIRCWNGTESNFTDVTVNTGAPPSIDADPERVRAGEPFDIEWDTNGSTPAQCSITGGGLSGYDPIDATNINPDQTGTIPNQTIAGETTYTITCPFGSDSFTVELIPGVFES